MFDASALQWVLLVLSMANSQIALQIPYSTRLAVTLQNPYPYPYQAALRTWSTRRRSTVDTGRGSESAGTFVDRASRRHRRLIQPATVRLPSIRTDTRACTARNDARVWRASGQPGMRPVTVVVALEIEELHLHISGRPEQRAVQAFAAYRADQPFHEWMRERHVRDGLD